jgi:hypothetical protein
MYTQKITTALLTLALCTGPYLLNAQESKVRVKVKADLAGKADEAYGVAKVVKGDAGSVVALKTKGGNPVMGGLSQVQTDWSLWSYSTETMTAIKNDKPKVVWGEGPVALETIEFFAGQFRLIATKPDPENGKLLIIQQIMSPRSLTGKGAQLITELPYDRLGKGADYYQSNMSIGFTTLVNADSTKLLLQLTPNSTTRSAGCPVFAMMLGKDLKPLWNFTLQTDPAAKEVKLLDTQVDKTGAVWYLTKNITDPAPKTQEVIGYNYVLYKLDSAGQLAVPIDLPAEDYAVDATLTFRKDGNIAVAGVYNHPDHKRNEAIGLFYSTLDIKTLAWGNWKQHPLEKQLVEVKTKKEERLQTDIIIDRVLPKKDGGAYLVSHGSARITTMVSDLSGAKKPKYSWDNWDLHIMELTASGDLRWYKTIERDMSFDNDIPGRLISATYDDALFILLNDDVSNFEKRKSKEALMKLTSAKDATVFEFKADGTERPRKALESEFDYGCFMFSRTWRIGQGLIATLGSYGFSDERTYPVLIQFSKEAQK